MTNFPVGTSITCFAQQFVFDGNWVLHMDDRDGDNTHIVVGVTTLDALTTEPPDTLEVGNVVFVNDLEDNLRIESINLL